VNIDAALGIVLDADGDNIDLKFGAAGHLGFSNDAGNIFIKQETSARDIIFIDSGDDAGLTIEDAAAGIIVPGEVKTTVLSYMDGDDAITISNGGGVEFANVRATANGGFDVDNLELDNNTLRSSSGALTLTAAAASTWSTATGALTLTSAAASTWSTGAGALTISGDDGLTLTAANTAGITMNSINGEFLVTATGQDIDLNSTSLTGDFTGALSLVSVGTSNLTNNGALTVAATGASGALTLTGAATSTWSTSAGALTVSAAAEKLTLNGYSGVDITGNANEIDLTTANKIEMNSSSVEIKGGVSAASLRLYEASGLGSNYIEFKTPDIDMVDGLQNVVYILPEDAGANGEVLSTNGSGTLSWAPDAISASSTTNSNVFGENNNNDVVFTSRGSAHDGIYKWVGANDMFEYQDHILLTPVSHSKLYFGDVGVYVWSSGDAALDLVSDGTVNIDATTDITLDAQGGDIFLKHATNEFGSLTKASGYNLIITSGTDPVMEFLSGNTEVKGDLTVTGDNIIMGTNTSGYILVADNTNYNPVAVSGDVTLANTGAVTIGATKVTGAMLNDDAISAQGALGGTGLHQTEDDFMFSDDGTLKKITFSNLEDAIFSHITGDISIAAGGAATVTGASTNAALTAGVGISAGGTFDGATARTFAIDLSEFSDVQIASGDKLLVLDSDGSTEQRESIDDIATLFAGTGLTATAGVLAVNASQTQITSVGTIATGTWEGTTIAVDQGGTGVTTKTGTGSVVLSNSPTLVTPALGTPSALVGTNISGTGSSFTAGNVTTNANLTGDVISSGNAASIAAGVIVDADINGSAAITATKIANGTVTSAEFQYIGGLTSDAQTQLDAKAPLASPTFTGTPIAPTASAGTDNTQIATTAYVTAAILVAHPGRDGSSSDRRFKKNISTVSGALEKLSKLNPVNYDWRKDEFENKGFNDKKQWGFIAQEVEKVIPELVGADEDDYLTLNYNGFVPLLTKAMQEQQDEIENQQKEIDELKAQLELIMKMMQSDMSDKTDNKKAENNEKPVKLSMATVK